MLIYPEPALKATEALPFDSAFFCEDLVLAVAVDAFIYVASTLTITAGSDPVTAPPFAAETDDVPENENFPTLPELYRKHVYITMKKKRGKKWKKEY